MWLFFVTQYNSSLPSFVPNFRALSQVVAEKSLTEKKNFIGEKEKRRNKGIDKQNVAVFCYRALSQVVAEKSLTEKKNHWRER